MGSEVTTITADETAFREAIAADPADTLPLLAYADWLDERGRPDEACDRRLDVALRAVCAAPADDAPRLEYAAVCDDYGRHERAEFVRVQCELARSNTDCPYWCDGTCPAGNLRRRERKLFTDATAMEWCRSFGRGYVEATAGSYTTGIIYGAHPENRRDFAVEFTRGFVSRVTCTLAAFVGGGVCGRCHGAQWEEMADAPVYIPCPDCGGTGRTPGLAGVLAGAVPLEGVTLSDREPVGPLVHRGCDVWSWDRREAHESHRAEDLPPAIFDRLPGGEPYARRLAGETTVLIYPSRDAALSAASLGAVDLARSRVAWASHPCPGCAREEVFAERIGTRSMILRTKHCPACKGKGRMPGLPPLGAPSGVVIDPPSRG